MARKANKKIHGHAQPFFLCQLLQESKKAISWAKWITLLSLLLVSREHILVPLVSELEVFLVS